MPEQFSAEVKGADELREGSLELAERIEDEAGDRFELVADKAAAAVRSAVPRLTGALAASVVSEEREGKAIVGIGGPDVPYAGWIEFGGARMGSGGGTAERPYIARGRYLYPAAFSAEPVLVVAGGRAADDEIRRFQWESPT